MLEQVRKIFLVWFPVAAVGCGLVFTIPHVEKPFAGWALRAIQAFCGITAWFVCKREVKSEMRALFAGFFLFFVPATPLFFLSDVLGDAILESDYPYMALYFVEYGNVIYFCALTFVMMYLGAMFLAEKKSPCVRSIISIVIAVTISIVFYHPILLDRKSLYRTTDIIDFRIIDRAVIQLRGMKGNQVTIDEIANQIELSKWEAGRWTGILPIEDEKKRISEILPYLSGSNHVVLVMRPLLLNGSYVSFVCLVVGLVAVIQKYLRDPPHSPYIEKLLFAMTMYCLFESFHSYTVAHAQDLQNQNILQTIGRYPTILTLILVELTLLLRLRYLLSHEGRYFEEKLRSNPHRVTRWRDEVDRFVLRHFFRRRKV